MIVTMHQPNFLPWCGFFYKMAKADLFVFTDTLGFSRGSYTQRVKIKTMNGPEWLTHSLLLTGKVSQPIMDIRCGGWDDWRERIVNALKGNYLKCPHYQPCADELAEIIMASDDNLARFNMGLIMYIAGKLGITTPTVCSSTFKNVSGKTTDWIIAACKEVGADTFLSGAGGANYQDEDAYGQAGIKLVYSDFKHPVYPQQFGEFVPGLSVVDLLFNCGPGSASILGL